MGKLLKNVRPYWKQVLIIIALLIVQAFCDLSLPQYTSDMIDTGIQNSGIEHILPEKITKEEYTYSTMFMTEEEQKQFEGAYKLEGDVYVLTIDDEKKLDELDDKLIVPIVMTYNMSNMEESSFKKMVAQTLAENPETEQAAAKVDSMTIEDIEKMLNIQLSTKEAEDENGVMKTYVDIRPMMAGFIANGSMDSELMSSSRQTMEKTIESIGSTQMKSMGIAFAVNCDTNAGIDVHNVQIKYLWAAGAKMIGMTMLMGAAAILLGYMASRVGAGVGRDLREKTFKQVVSFSNAEMDKFSTASLITRSTMIFSKYRWLPL